MLKAQRFANVQSDSVRKGGVSEYIDCSVLVQAACKYGSCDAYVCCRNLWSYLLGRTALVCTIFSSKSNI